MGDVVPLAALLVAERRTFRREPVDRIEEQLGQRGRLAQILPRLLNSR